MTPLVPPSAVYVIGAPASGKSTLVQALLHAAQWYVLPDAFKLTPLLAAQRLVDPDGRASGLLLGRTREGGFPGTDALSMGVSPQAVAWATSLGDPTRDHRPSLVVGEGARLGTGKFLTALAAHTRLHLIYLTTLADVLDERCLERGSNQSESWRKGAASSAFGALAAVQESGHAVSITALDTSLDTAPALARTLLRGPLGGVL